MEASGEPARLCHDSLSEGSLVNVKGRVRTREWTADDGSRQRVTYLRAEEVKRLDDASPEDVSRRDERPGGREEPLGGTRFEPAESLPF